MILAMMCLVILVGAGAFFLGGALGYKRGWLAFRRRVKTWHLKRCWRCKELGIDADGFCVHCGEWQAV